MESKRHILFRILLLLMECVLLCSECNTSMITYTSQSGLTCVKCAPGTHFLEDCKKDKNDAKCKLCDEGFYTCDYNIATKCDPCRTYCPSDQLVPVKNCSRISNMICGCPEGKFNLFPNSDMSRAVCQDYGPCGPGYGVLTKGTHDKNTTCERCIVGMTFSPTTSTTEKCRPCASCGNFPVSSECNATHDRVCAIIHDMAKTAGRHGIDMDTITWALPLALFILFTCIIMLILWKTNMLCFKEPVPEKAPIPDTTVPGYQNPVAMTSVCSDVYQVFPRADQRHIKMYQLQESQQQTANIICDDSIIQTLANELICYKDWRHFIRQLYSDSNLGDADKTIIKVSVDYNDNIEERIYQCCSMWRNRCGQNATPTHLINVLEKGEFKAIANTLRNKFPDKFPFKESTV